MPASENEGHLSPSELSGARSSLLRVSRRHSLPAVTGVSGILSFWSRQQETNHSNSEVDGSARAHGNGHTSAVTPYMRETPHMHSSSVVVERIVPGNGGVGNNIFHRSHRHTRSEILDRPVIVKSYNPDLATAPHAALIEEEEDDDFPLPSIEDFSFDGILKAVDPHVTLAIDSITELCSKYQDSVGREASELARTQGQLDSRQKETDKLAAQVLKTTKLRTDKLEAETAGLKGGVVVEKIAEATESTHAIMTSIISTLLAIDEMLPPQERLSPENSAHRKHYPELHTLLVSKATELNLCFGSGRVNSRKASMADNANGTGESSSGAFLHGDSQMTPAQIRRMSSGSQYILSDALKRSHTFSESRQNIVSPPQLQLRTILPTGAADSPKIVESANGSYFPIAPRTATGISLNAPFATGQTSDQHHPELGPPRRGSGMRARRPSTSAMAFSPIDELESVNNGTKFNNFQPPALSRRFSWRGSGTWSGFGGLFSKKSSQISSESRRERAEDKLKAVLQARTSKGKGLGIL